MQRPWQRTCARGSFLSAGSTAADPAFARAPRLVQGGPDGIPVCGVAVGEDDGHWTLVHLNVYQQLLLAQFAVFILVIKRKKRCQRNDP